MEPIRKTIDVPCAPAEAFRIFTAEIDRWWPKDQNSVSAGEGKAALAIELEPREGGELTETDYNGDTHKWGSVRIWSPPDRLVLAWHVGAPPEQATTVEVAFEDSERGTRVVLVHSGWENAADPSSRDSYDDGWDNVFTAKYAGACLVAE